MSELNYIVTADNKGFIETMKDTKAQMRETTRDIEKSGMSIEDAFERIKKSATGALAGFTVKEFVSKVAQVRGEFQQLEVAFTTMLGSAEKANELILELTRTAASTPFDLQGVANGAKQLLAYGVAADKVNDTLVHLGDIAAGLSIPLNDLVMLYGTTMTQGRMFTQDLRQFMGRGIPLADELAKQFGVTKDKVGELVTAGKVGAEEFNRAIMSMSSEGGRFAGLMDAQSKTIAGQISNIEDAIDMMFNEIGQKNEGLINDVLGDVSYLVENYEKVGQAILTVALAYGEWKAAEMLLAATTSAVAKQRAAIDAERVSGLSAIATEYNAVIAAEESEAAAETANTAAKGANVSAIDAEIASLGNLLTARLTEAEAALAAAEQESLLAQNRLREAQLSTAAYEQQYQAALLLGDGEKIEAAENALNTAASNENAAAKAAQSAQDNVAAASKAKEAAATQLATFQTKVDTVNKQANTAATGLWAAATRSVTAALHSMKAAMASNPFGLALVAITSIISLLTLFRTETEESTEALDKLRDAALGSTQKLDTYRAVLATVDKTSAQYKKTIQDLNAMADEYHTTLFTEKDTVDELAIKYDELTEAIRASTAQRLLAESASKASKDSMKAEKDAMDDLMDDAEDFSYKMYNWENNGHVRTKRSWTVQAEDIQKITATTWNAISQMVMSHSKDIAAAAEQGGEAYQEAINNEVELIRKMLKEAGVSDQTLNHFNENLRKYVESSSKGFKDAYNELGRTEAQLRGVANAAKDTKDITNAAIDEMNYEQLQEHLKKVQNKIDEINAKTLDIDTDDTELIKLRNLLQKINDLLPTQLTVGSDAELEKRLKDAREQRDKQVYGSEEWKKYNNQVSQLNTTLTTHKKSYAENSARSSKDASTAAREKAKLQKEQQEYLELIEKQKQERERAVQDMQFSTRQAEIDALSEGSEKTLAQLSLDFEKQRIEIERGYEDLKQKKIEAARELWEANPDNKDKVFDPNTVNTDYTEAETDNYKALLEANQKQYERSLLEQREAEIQSLRDYLKEYGTFQQQKLAIAEEYAKKIRKAEADGKKGEVLRLQAEQKKMEGSAKAQELARGIDFSQMFEGVGTIVKSIAEETYKRVQEYKGTDEYKNSTPENKKAIADLEAKLIERGGAGSASPFSSKTWDNITTAAQTYDEALKQLQVDYEAHTAAVEEQKTAHKALNTILEGFNAKNVEEAIENIEKMEVPAWRKNLFKESVSSAQSAVQSADKKASETAEKQQESETNVQQAGKNVQTAASAAAKGLQDFNTILGQIKGGSLAGFADGVSNVIAMLTKKTGDDMEGLVGLIGEKAGGIIGAILSVIDMLGENPTEVINGILDGVSKVVEEVIAHIPEIIEAAVKGIGNIVGGVFNGLGRLFGLGELGSIFNGGNEEETAARESELVKSNESLQKSIDKARESLDKQNGTTFLKTAEQMLKDQAQIIKNQWERFENEMGYHSSHHSNDYYWEGFSDEQIRRMNQIFSEHGSKDNNGNQAHISGRSWRELGNLSPEAIDDLRTYDTDLWEWITSRGKYGEVYDQLEAYADLAGKISEIEKQITENLTQLSETALHDQFLSELMDMEKDAEDFGDDFTEILTKAVLNAEIGSILDKDLEEWRKSLAERMKGNGGRLKSGDVEALRKQWDDIVERGIAIRDQVAEITGYTDLAYQQQSATGRGISNISYEQADALEGILLGHTMLLEQGNQTAGMILTSVQAMENLMTSASGNLSEIRNLIFYANSTRDTMLKVMKEHFENFTEQMNRIVDEIKNQ